MLDSTKYKVFTIGVYGFTEERFFDALKSAKVNVLCDIRRRRGVRGSKYRFANAKYLEKRLQELGIGYHHAIELAPSNEVRATQWKADKKTGVSKVERTQIDETFASAYQRECLSDFNAAEFISRVLDGRVAVCFLCVEKEPAACHRSLVTATLKSQLLVSCEDIVP